MVPKNLTPQQRETRKMWQPICLEHTEINPELLSRVITSDESWFFSVQSRDKMPKFATVLKGITQTKKSSSASVPTLLIIKFFITTMSHTILLCQYNNFLPRNEFQYYHSHIIHQISLRAICFGILDQNSGQGIPFSNNTRCPKSCNEGLAGYYRRWVPEMLPSIAEELGKRYFYEAWVADIALPLCLGCDRVLSIKVRPCTWQERSPLRDKKQGQLPSSDSPTDGFKICFGVGSTNRLSESLTVSYNS
ncbi:hypothetical protein J6590_020631 [Homalodisca vitripennis]|nr:hypothetical protein J6590_020631 [Homalodisca vitripennis]